MAATTEAPAGFRSPGARRRGLRAHEERLGATGMEPAMLGLTLFVASEVLFFAGLFGAYFTFRTQAAGWPGVTLKHVEIEKPNVPYAAWLTVILVSSSITMQASIFAIRKNMKRATTGLITLTFVLGTIFVSLQGREWKALNFDIKDGIYPALFYTITGFHGLHVLGGLVAIGFVLVKSAVGEFTPDHHIGLEAVSFYWHFVDVVWVFVFSILYLSVR